MPKFTELVNDRNKVKFRFCDSKSSVVDSLTSAIILQGEEALACKLTRPPTSVENDCG